MLKRLLSRLTSPGRVPPSAPPPDVPANDRADRLISDGNHAENLGDPRRACELYREAVDCAPGYAASHLNLGIGLTALGDAVGAAKSFRAALAIDPGNAYANYNLANLLYGQRELPEAERLLRLALERKPEFPEAHVALSNVLDSRGDLAAAAASLEAALKLRPDWAGALCNYGIVLKKLRRPAEAEAALRRALAVDPACTLASRSLGGLLHSEGRIEDALETYRKGRERDPSSFELESLELFALNFHENISHDALFARHRAFGERLEKAHPRRFPPFRNSRDPRRRLRIGYVSGDFYYHPVLIFLTPVLERRDRSAFEVYCYSTGERADELTRKMPGQVDVWREAGSKSEAELADAINRDEIDVLVDLSGHSGRPSLGAFARQPAPVQVTWLGYLNTTGTTRIQYRLCDACTDPPGAADRLHTETLVRLPNSQWCYRPFLSVDFSGTPPFARSGFVTFGSFNDVSKISPTVRKLWAQILAQSPLSRLVIVGASEGHARDGLIRDFSALGVDPARVEVLPRLNLDEYFGRFNAVDIALDTMPYSGGTTTCDALWMGVPVITLPGSRSASRSSASILSTAGLPEWIASSPEAYVELAVRSARDPRGLTELRGSLRNRLLQSPLMDEPGFARDLEDAYRRMWQEWCRDAGK